MESRDIPSLLSAAKSRFRPSGFIGIRNPCTRRQGQLRLVKGSQASDFCFIGPQRSTPVNDFQQLLMISKAVFPSAMVHFPTTRTRTSTPRESANRHSTPPPSALIRHSSFGFLSSFGLRHSSFSGVCH